MNVEVVVPWRGGCRYRERAYDWVGGKLFDAGLTVREAIAPEGPWRKGAAIWSAVQESSADIIVMHDADVWSDGLDEAIRRVKVGEPWTMPHERVWRLTDAATIALIENRNHPRHIVEPTYRGVWGGGIVVMPRDTYLSVPIDPRFTVWGQEDCSWALALWQLAGKPSRFDADLLHLYHPPARRLNRMRGSAENWELLMRYRKARNDPAALREIVNEAITELEEGHVASHVA